MAREPQLELRVSRLENDMSSIYELLTEVRSTQEEHSKRFVKIDRRFVKIDQRFDTIEMTLAEIVRRLPEPS